MAAAADKKHGKTALLAGTEPLSKKERKIAEELLELFKDPPSDATTQRIMHIIDKRSDVTLARLTNDDLFPDGAKKLLRFLYQNPALQPIWCERIRRYSLLEDDGTSYPMRQQRSITPLDTLFGNFYYNKYARDPIRPKELTTSAPQQARIKLLKKAALKYKHFMAQARLIQMRITPLAEELADPKKEIASFAIPNLSFKYDQLAKIITDHTDALKDSGVPGFILLAILRIIAANYFGQQKNIPLMCANYQLAMHYLKVALQLAITVPKPDPDMTNAFGSLPPSIGFLGGINPKTHIEHQGLFRFTTPRLPGMDNSASPALLCRSLEKKCHNGFSFFVRITMPTKIVPEVSLTVPFGQQWEERTKQEVKRIAAAAATITEETTPVQKAPT